MDATQGLFAGAGISGSPHWPACTANPPQLTCSLAPSCAGTRTMWGTRDERSDRWRRVLHGNHQMEVCQVGCATGAVSVIDVVGDSP